MSKKTRNLYITLALAAACLFSARSIFSADVKIPAATGTATGTASGTGGTASSAVPTFKLEAKKPETTVVEVSPEGLMEKVSNAYSAANSFTLTFSVTQDVPKQMSKISEARLKKLESKYLLKYKDDDPKTPGYLLRLEGISGDNKGTTVVYAPDSKGEYVYRVYKPALPKGALIKADSPLVRDVSKTPSSAVVQELAGYLGDTETVKRAYFNPKLNLYTLEIVVSLSYKNQMVPHKIVTEFDGKNFFLRKQEVFLDQRRNLKQPVVYLFWTRRVWLEYNPEAVLTEKEITAAPKFTRE